MGWGQNWGTALYGDPGDPLLDYLDGFEHQSVITRQYGGSGTGIWDTVNNSGAMSFTAGRTGVCLHIVESGTSVTDAIKFVPLTQTRVFSGYFRAAATPAAASWIWVLNDAAGALIARLRLETDGSLNLASADGGTSSFSANFCDNNWHLVDLLVDTSCLRGDRWYTSWAVDGVTGFEAESLTGKVATDSRRLVYGSTVSTHNATVDWDDCIASSAIGVYPIGEHSIGFTVPTSDGTHAAGTNVIESSAVGSPDIGVTTAFDLMDEWPANASDYVRQAAVGASNYAEVNFADTADTLIWSAAATAAMYASSTIANDGTARIVDSAGTTLMDIYSGDMSETNLHFRTVILPVPTGGWSTAGLNDLRARVGFSTNVTTLPRWSSLMIQYVVGVVGDAQEVDVGTISQTPSVFAIIRLTNPKATLGLISRVPTLFVHKLRKTIPLGLIASTRQVFAPSKFTRKVLLTDTGGFQQTAFDDDTFQMGTSFAITRTTQLFAPTFPANPQTVTLPGFATATVAAFQDDAFQDTAFQDSASVSAGGAPQYIGTPFTLSFTGQAVGAQVILGAGAGWDSEDITWDDTDTDWDAAGLGGQINQIGHLFTPTVVSGLTLGLISNTPTLFAPSVAGKFVNLGFINRSGFVHTPQQFTEKVNLGTIGALTGVFDLVVSTPSEVELDLIDQSPTLYAFQLNTLFIPLPFINRSGFTFTPSQVSQTIVVGLIASTQAVYAPIVNAITLGFINQSGVALGLNTVLFNPDDVVLDLIASTVEVFEPPLINLPFQQTIRLDETAEQFIDNAGIVFAPEDFVPAAPQFVFMGFINRTGHTFNLRVFLPSRPTIVLHARYDPVTVLRARYDPVTVKHAQDTRQGA